MEKLPLDLLEYYEHQIRAASQETASIALLQNADRLLGLIKEETCVCSRGNQSGSLRWNRP